MQTAGTIGEVLADLREVVATGAFVHASDKDDCKWCNFHYACGKAAREAAAGGRPRTRPVVAVRLRRAGPRRRPPRSALQAPVPAAR